ncbi:hypothetical protein QNI16_19055 [Cytophagaceae bacterium YF14B1]|uniref:Fibronectin type-III domain-containing protein n=1 Tax=Xanthocytophaga flava TaxID=3048013 RepID=A0AAE3QNH4_9BACT|nr:hypothetical protein [Xanthocytophaga flavus]MDJ1482607.1 hypothetical protein [Xanthocytophaga flavus]
MKPFTGILFSTFLYVIGQLPVHSQSPQPGLKVLAKPHKGAVLIRWAPTTPLLWKRGNESGYLIERYTLKPDGSFEELGGGKLMTTQAIKPISAAAFDELEKTEPKAAIVGEMVYGTDFSPALSTDKPADILKKNNEQENRFGMALFICDVSQPSAIAAGLLWIDKTVLPGKRYVYKVRLAAPAKDGSTLEGSAIVNSSEEQKLLPPDRFKVEFKDRRARLSWPIFLHQGVYTAYVIEKSSDGNLFHPVSDLPYTYVSLEENPEYAYYTDSLETNEQVYHYRIRAITPFGEITEPSAVVHGQGMPEMAGMAVIESAQVKENKQVTLQWRFPAELQKKISGYFVSRSSKPGGPYQDIHKKLLPSTQFTYQDQPTSQNTYYQIRIIGKDGKELSRSFPYLVQLEDQIPPAVPARIQGTVTDRGIVSLQWQANTDTDIQGYRVFRANSLSEESIEVTRRILTKPVFTDTISLTTLTSQVYYRVVAVDNNFNTSAYSPAFALSRPDKVPPVAAVFTQTEIRTDSIVLRWIGSPSRDIASYRLWRQGNEPSDTITLSSWRVTMDKQSFIDTKVSPGKSYHYILDSKDSSGNITKAESREIYFETGFRDAVSWLTPSINREKRKITLNWNNESFKDKEIVKLILYKKEDNAPLSICQTLTGSVNSWEDLQVALNHRYTYCIKVYYKDGAQSRLSKPLQLVY